MIYKIAERTSSIISSAADGDEKKKGSGWLNYLLGLVTFGLVMYFMTMMRKKNGSGGGKGLFGNKLGGKAGPSRGSPRGGRAAASAFGGSRGSGGRRR